MPATRGNAAPRPSILSTDKPRRSTRLLGTHEEVRRFTVETPEQRMMRAEKNSSWIKVSRNARSCSIRCRGCDDHVDKEDELYRLEGTYNLFICSECVDLSVVEPLPECTLEGIPRGFLDDAFDESFEEARRNSDKLMQAAVSVN